MGHPGMTSEARSRNSWECGHDNYGNHDMFRVPWLRASSHDPS